MFRCRCPVVAEGVYTEGTAPSRRVAVQPITEGNPVQPSIGRIVHYTSHGSPVLPDGSQRYAPECRAAVVTEVEDGHTVSLCVLNPTGQFFSQGVVFDDDDDPRRRAGGSWHWPERVEVEQRVTITEYGDGRRTPFVPTSEAMRAAGIKPEDLA